MHTNEPRYSLHEVSIKCSCLSILYSTAAFDRSKTSHRKNNDIDAVNWSSASTILTRLTKVRIMFSSKPCYSQTCQLWGCLAGPGFHSIDSCVFRSAFVAHLDPDNDAETHPTTRTHDVGGRSILPNLVSSPQPKTIPSKLSRGFSPTIPSLTDHIHDSQHTRVI